MLKNMMDGFQTKTEFEERAAERLRADDGWISQLHCLATAHSAHSTTQHATPQKKNREEITSFGRKHPSSSTHTQTHRLQNDLT